MKNYKVILPILAIVAYIAIIWPWGESEKAPSVVLKKKIYPKAITRGIHG